MSTDEFLNENFQDWIFLVVFCRRKLLTEGKENGSFQPKPIDVIALETKKTARFFKDKTVLFFSLSFSSL